MRGNGGNGRTRLAVAAVRFQPDSRLVGLVREGHDVAFEEIVRRYRSPLVGFAGAIVPADHAEDVVQEALAKAHQTLGRGDAEINLRPWLYTIVRNRALNALRDEPVHDHLDENFDGVPQPPEVAARREELANLVERLNRLPDQQRVAIVKRELEGQSHDDIAGSLGLSAGAVRGLIYRARATLRDGAGLLIPMPVLRFLLSSGSGADASGAAGAAATLAVGGGGGVALKAGATLGVAVIAVGSGIAVQHHGGEPNDPTTMAQQGAGHSHPQSSANAMAGARRTQVRGHGAESSTGSGPGGPDDTGSSGPSGDRSSGPGDGSRSSGSDSGPGGGSSGGGSSGSGGDDPGGASGSGDDGGGSGTSGSGTSGSGDDGGGSGTSGSGGGDDGGGGITGSGDDGSGTSDGGGTSGSGDDGGTTGSDDGVGDVTTGITTGDDGGIGDSD